MIVFTLPPDNGFPSTVFIVNTQGEKLKVDPSFKMFKKLVTKNAIKPKKVYPNQKNVRNPLDPPNKNCQKPN